MAAIFKLGERVRALSSVQGLVRGQEYVIERVRESLILGMLFVTYQVGGREIINGHLLLERV
jgi:hypothetical protein